MINAGITGDVRPIPMELMKAVTTRKITAALLLRGFFWGLVGVAVLMVVVQPRRMREQGSACFGTDGPMDRRAIAEVR
ncbi:MAG: hypothetical protein AAFX44_15955 [Pseudomonadota bacterium]